jgi:hypothetical protein
MKALASDARQQHIKRLENDNRQLQETNQKPRPEGRGMLFSSGG